MPLVKQVILFVIDGLRPDALQQAHTPEIDRLVAQGAHTWQAQTIMPSVSLPCHISLFFAVPPARHGVVSNVWTPPVPPVPSLIEVVHQAGLGTAAFYTWEPLRDLASPGALDIAYYRRLGDSAEEQVLEIGATAATFVAEQKPALTFVYLEAPDAVGHRHGWMSAPYLRAVSKTDRAVGLVLEPLRASGSLADTVCLVLADHGGHDYDHSAGLAEDLTIPWIISGSNIRRGYSIMRPVNITDTAPTIAHLLGLPAPVEWSGRAVTEVLASWMEVTHAHYWHRH
jgi:predicted AlkP superfamily pyrophosphatase or phosphodiesterase